jgi:hypothetical protein
VKRWDKHEKVAQNSFPADLDQASDRNPADPEPILQEDLDQSWGP